MLAELLHGCDSRPPPPLLFPLERLSLTDLCCQSFTPQHFPSSPSSLLRSALHPQRATDVLGRRGVLGASVRCGQWLPVGRPGFPTEPPKMRGGLIGKENLKEGVKGEERGASTSSSGQERRAEDTGRGGGEGRKDKLQWTSTKSGTVTPIAKAKGGKSFTPAREPLGEPVSVLIIWLALTH